MSSRACPDWPELMELAPELQFRHLTLAEVQLPAEAVVKIGATPRDTVAICCDPDAHVFYARHTLPVVAEALASTHWMELHDWAAHNPAA